MVSLAATLREAAINTEDRETDIRLLVKNNLRCQLRVQHERHDKRERRNDRTENDKPHTDFALIVSVIATYRLTIDVNIHIIHNAIDNVITNKTTSITFK